MVQIEQGDTDGNNNNTSLGPHALLICMRVCMHLTFEAGLDSLEVRAGWKGGREGRAQATGRWNSGLEKKERERRERESKAGSAYTNPGREKTICYFVPWSPAQQYRGATPSPALDPTAWW